MRRGEGDAGRIAGMVGRGGLGRLRGDELTIAVHARRGDFFREGRPMISVRAFARVVRRVVDVVNGVDGVFARMGVMVNVYSEGGAVNGSVGHDVGLHSKVFRDADGGVLSRGEVRRVFLDEEVDGLGKVFRNGLRVELRVSEDTVECLHEMIAADVFVGSKSGMSLHVVGSLSRGAMQILPVRSEEESEWRGVVLFDGRSGHVARAEVERMRRYWREFEIWNEDSARMALSKEQT